VRTEFGYEVIVDGEPIENALVVLTDAATAAPVDLYGDPFSTLPLALPILSDDDGWVRGWLAYSGELRMVISDNSGLARLVSNPSQTVTFDPFDVLLLVPNGGGGGQATVCKTVLLTGVGASYMTAAKARRVSVTWDNASSSDALRPTIDGVPLAPTTGPSTVVFGTLESSDPLPPITVQTNQNNDSVTVTEEC